MCVCESIGRLNPIQFQPRCRFKHHLNNPSKLLFIYAYFKVFKMVCRVASPFSTMLNMNTDQECDGDTACVTLGPIWPCLVTMTRELGLLPPHSPHLQQIPSPLLLPLFLPLKLSPALLFILSSLSIPPSPPSPPPSHPPPLPPLTLFRATV